MGYYFENWVIILKIRQFFWKSDKNLKIEIFLKIKQKFENQAKIWKSGKNLKIVQKFENRAKFWKSGNSENFEARVISRQKLVPQIRASFTKWRARIISSHKFSGTNDARGQMTRAREMRVDTRCLPEAVTRPERPKGAKDEFKQAQRAAN